jgi:hypothetical protein
MTIQDAIKSEKPFRLPNWYHAGHKPYWAIVGKTKLNLPIVVEAEKKFQIVLCNLEILSDEWIVKK